MCSIIGAAGPIAELPPKLKQEFHEFLSCLFTMAELRGRDASGFWVWRDNHYVAEKRAYAAEDLIQRSARWKSLRFNPGSLYLCHTRAATDGDPNDNINNHPHKGDHTVMIHNGCIWNHETLAHQNNLDMKSDCDSEVLLRLVETKDAINEGLKHMFRVTHESSGAASIATAFVDRRSPDRIYLSRNSGNPCFVYRSERFNCTFFCSTELIFENALKMMYKTDKPAIIGAGKADSITPYWLYELSEDGTYQENHLINVHSAYSGHHQGNYAGQQSWDDDDDDTDVNDYITTIVNKQGFTVDIAGLMTPFEEIEEEVELTLVDDDEVLEFTEAEEMSTEVYDDLVQYINETIGVLE